MSKTPRTDEREFAAIDLKPSARVVYASFARQLEAELADKDRQLAKARAEIERKDKLIERLKCCTNCGSRLWAATGKGNCKNCKDFSAWTSQNKAALAAEMGE